MNILAYGEVLYSYFKKGFLFGIDYELGNFIPYTTLTDSGILIAERAQILLLKSFNFVI
jgi:hypothetical protein